MPFATYPKMDARMPSKTATPGTDAEPNSSSDPSLADQWEGAFVAINRRWPSISREELRKLPRTIGDLASYVAQRVDANLEEIEAVVVESNAVDSSGQGKSALHSVVDPIAHRAHQASDQVAGSIHSAFERIQYEVDEAPMKTSLTTFILGFGLGLLTATLLFRPDPQPTAWQSLKSKRLYGR